MLAYEKSKSGKSAKPVGFRLSMRFAGVLGGLVGEFFSVSSFENVTLPMGNREIHAAVHRPSNTKSPDVRRIIRRRLARFPTVSVFPLVCPCLFVNPSTCLSD